MQKLLLGLGGLSDLALRAEGRQRLGVLPFGLVLGEHLLVEVASCDRSELPLVQLLYDWSLGGAWGESLEPSLELQLSLQRD